MNVDYLVIAALDAYLSRAVMTVLLGAALLFDVAFTFGPTFNFGPTEVLAAVEQVRNFSGRAILFALAVIGIVLLLAAAIVRLRGARTATSGRRRLLAYCATALSAAYLLDIANGSNTVLWRPRTTLPVDVAASTFAGQYVSGLQPPLSSRTVLPAASDELRAVVAAATDSTLNAPPKIVLVLVESMGVPRGADLSSLFGLFMADSIAERYAVRVGAVPFFGGTTSGELRELCGARMSHTTALQRPLDACLPVRLRSLGYETIALHGYNGSLFQRLDWYPRVGFQRILFQSDLQSRNRLPECGMMFHGVCDSSMIPILRDELTRDPRSRQFIYWMTLSSHFPIDPRSGAGDPACRALGAVREEPSACALWHALQPALRGIAGLAADPTVPPAWYIVVGDHSPPPLLSDPRLFVTDRVSYVELRPKK